MIGSLPPGLVLVLGALALPLLPRKARSAAFLVVTALAFVHLVQLPLGTIATVSYLGYELVVTRVDELSRVFGIVFLLIALMGGFYAFHLRETGQQVSALLYGGAALGVVFAGDLLTLFLWWEVMAIASTYLIWARQRPESSRAGMRYLLVHLFGGALLLAGILLHLLETGSLRFDGFEGGAAAVLILLGFAVNAAIPPLHAWLPDAYPEATVTGSVFLSAFTTKSAVYVLARGFAGWEILIWAGTIMALYGVVFAIIENDIRRLLAYHIVSQVGYMVAGVGIGTELAINGASAHAFTHVIYKGLLFMGAGAVLYSTSRSRATELGGLAPAMPWVVVLYMVGAFSISGVPLFSGFVSKSMVVYAAERADLVLPAMLLILASVGTFLSVGLKLPYVTWFGPSGEARPMPVPWGMYVGMGLASIASIAIGVYPAVLYDILPFPVAYDPFTWGHFREAIQLLVFTGLAFVLMLKKLGAEPTITLDTDWPYRITARPAYALVIAPVDRFFAGADKLLARTLVSLHQIGSDPSRLVFGLLEGARAPSLGPGPGKEQVTQPATAGSWVSMAVAVLVVLLSVIVLTLLTLVRLAP